MQTFLFYMGKFSEICAIVLKIARWAWQKQVSKNCYSHPIWGKDPESLSSVVLIKFLKLENQCNLFLCQQIWQPNIQSRC